MGELRSNEPISLQFYPNESAATMVDAGMDLVGDADTGTYDLGVFPIPFPCEVYEAHVVITESLAGATITGTNTVDIEFDRRFNAGSDTGRGAADVAQIKLGYATGASSQGNQVYDRAGVGVTLNPGMEVVVECRQGPGIEGAGGTGIIWPMLLVKYAPQLRANVTEMQETA